MSRELYILRHSKSDWDSHSSDHQRPLNKRGRENAELLAVWMQAQYLYPGMIYCSTALRARETLAPVITTLEISADRIIYTDKLYLAELSTLLMFLCAIDSNEGSVMLVGHNPGMDELVTYLAAEPVPCTATGKLMTTSCLARFKMPDDWCQLQHRAELISITRPNDITL